MDIIFEKYFCRVFQWLLKSTPIQQKHFALLNILNTVTYKHISKILSHIKVIFWLSIDDTICVFNHKLSLFCCLDFTALLVDIIGNSTSYLTEIFKSTSILSGLHFLFTSIFVLFVWFTPGMEASIGICIKAYCSYSAALFLQSMDCSCKQNLLRGTRYIYNVYIYNIETYMFL